MDGPPVASDSPRGYAWSLRELNRLKETKALMRINIPVAPRVLGEGHEITLRMRWNFAMALYSDDGAKLDDLRAAVTTLEEIERIARRVFGGAHPLTKGFENDLRVPRAALRAGETPPASQD